MKQFVFSLIVLAALVFGYQSLKQDGESLAAIEQASAETAELPTTLTAANSQNSASAKPDTIEQVTALNLQQIQQIRECRNIPRREEELQARIERAAAENEPAAFIDDLGERFERCKDVERVDIMPTLFALAEQGDDAAVAELWQVSDREYFGTSEKLDAPALTNQRKTFHQRKRDIAQKVAAQGGERSALIMMEINQKFDPVLELQDLPKALSYAIYLQALSDDDEVLKKARWNQDKLERTLEQGDIAAAREIASQWIAHIKH